MIADRQQARPYPAHPMTAGFNDPYDFPALPKLIDLEYLARRVLEEGGDIGLLDISSAKANKRRMQRVIRLDDLSQNLLLKGDTGLRWSGF
jgi:hypothetical protein